MRVLICGFFVLKQSRYRFNVAWGHVLLLGSSAVVHQFLRASGGVVTQLVTQATRDAGAVQVLHAAGEAPANPLCSQATRFFPVPWLRSLLIFSSPLSR